MAHYKNSIENKEQNSKSLIDHLKVGPKSECLVEPSAAEKTKVKAMIHKKLPNLRITNIKSVKNPYLEASFLLKKEEYKSRNGSVNEMLLIHATSASNVATIIRDNFDWRRVRRGKFGWGNSFSNDARHAHRYANWDNGAERVFFIVKVLVSRQTAGREGLKLPPDRCDTTVGNKSSAPGSNTVYVKYMDNEFLPVYVAYYNSGDVRDPSCDDFGGNYASEHIGFSGPIRGQKHRHF